MQRVTGARELRPFPALDPEPPSRFTWRQAGLAAAGCAVVAVVAAVVLVAWPSSSAPKRVQAVSFADGDGLVVFKQLSSSMLGTAAPDGSHAVILSKLGALQGTDLLVASSDGRYLVDQEGELVTMGPAGPVSVTTVPESAREQQSGSGWMDASFADGSKYVEGTECFQYPNLTDRYIANLIPTAGGSPRVLDTVTDSTGDPGSDGALESMPADPATAYSFNGCGGPNPLPDKAIDLVQPGQPPRTIITATAVAQALGMSAGAQLELFASPSPDGSVLAVSAVPTSQQGQSRLFFPSVLVMVTRTGKITGKLQIPADSIMQRWSPDGREMAFCQARLPSQAGPTTVTVSAVGKAARTIVLPGRHDEFCTQLLWSPDGTQLIYAAQVTESGLDQADKLQHGWTVIDLASGRVHNVTAPGQPVAWLPVAGRTQS